VAATFTTDKNMTASYLIKRKLGTVKLIYFLHFLLPACIKPWPGE
jgi:hypothetical protein